MPLWPPVCKHVVLSWLAAQYWEIIETLGGRPSGGNGSQGSEGEVDMNSHA